MVEIVVISDVGGGGGPFDGMNSSCCCNCISVMVMGGSDVV